MQAPHTASILLDCSVQINFPMTTTPLRFLKPKMKHELATQAVGLHNDWPNKGRYTNGL